MKKKILLLAITTLMAIILTACPGWDDTIGDLKVTATAQAIATMVAQTAQP